MRRVYFATSYNKILFLYKYFISFLLKIVGDTKYPCSDLNPGHSNLLESSILKRDKKLLSSFRELNEWPSMRIIAG